MNRLTQKIISFLILSATLLSCGKEDKVPTFHLGDIEYYSDFLWCDGDTTCIDCYFDFDFSDDAKHDKCFGCLAFVDQQGNPISDRELVIKVDEKRLLDNIYHFDSSINSVHIFFTAGPDIREGMLQGQLKLTEHNLQRFENKKLEQGEPIIINKKWSIDFEETWNPLKLFLVITLLVLIGLLVLWFVILRPIFCPRFRVNRLQINSQKQGYYINKRINGAKKVIFSSQPIKQSTLNRIFTRKIINIVSPIWENSWELNPNGRKKEVKVNLHGKYTIDPIAVSLKTYGEYTLTDEKSNTIKIQIL